MAADKIMAIQEALLQKGFGPGEIDGVWGRRTIDALRAFQRSVGLPDDGVNGPATENALFSAAAAPVASPLLPWLAEAKNLMGTKEILGERSNPVILDWARDLDIQYKGDDIPWCGLFIAHCIGSSLPSEALPRNPLGARQWARFGDSTAPRLGAVMVFWREAIDSDKGHVGFYTGEDERAFRLLGGNQNNSVCLTWLDKERLIGARWPRSAAALAGAGTVVVQDRNEPLSANEA